MSYLKVSFPNGDSYLMLIRGLSVTVGRARVEKRLAIGEAFSCFGEHAALHAGAEESAAFRRLPLPELIAEVRALPWDDGIAMWCLLESERMTEGDFLELVFDVERLAQRRPFVVDLLVKYSGGDWDRATVTSA